MKIAIERKSSVLASNAVHHRIDSLTSIVALCAIGGSHFLHNASWLDPVGGLLVSIMVINAGYGNTRTALLELADVGLERDVKDSVQEALGEAGVEGVTEVSGVKSGQNYLVEVTVEVDPSLRVRETLQVEERIREVLGSPEGRKKVRGLRMVKVRFVEKGGSVTGRNEFLGLEEAGEDAVVENGVNGHTHTHEHDDSYEVKNNKLWRTGE